MDASHGSHREFALHQYEKAIQGLRESMNHVDHNRSIRASVISCLVLAFFDNFIGNGGFALQHIRHARGLLVASRVVAPAVVTSKSTEEDQLASMFLRLDMQALCAMGIEENRTFIALQPHTPDFTLPLRFCSVEEARSTRNMVVWEGYNFFYRAAKHEFSPPNQIPASILRLRDHLIEQIHLLHSLLDSLMLDIEPDLICHPLSRPESLKLYTTVLLIRLTSSLGNPESACDDLIPYFEFLLDISRETLEYEAAGNPSVFGTYIFSVVQSYTAAWRARILFLKSPKLKSSQIHRPLSFKLFFRLPKSRNVLLMPSRLRNVHARSPHHCAAFTRRHKMPIVYFAP